MTEIIYDWYGTNKGSSLEEGAKLIFPGVSEEFVDQMIPKGNLIFLKTLRRININSKTGLLLRDKEIIEQWYTLNVLEGNIISCKTSTVGVYIEGITEGYTEASTRLEEFTR